MSHDRRAAALEGRLEHLGPSLPAAGGPAADPRLAGWLARTAHGENAPRLEIGWVVDCAAGGHCYRVLAGPAGYVWATPSADGSFASFGARPVGTVPLGSDVVLLRHPQEPGVATILAVLPHWSVHRAGQPADALWPFFRSGHAADFAHVLPVVLSTAAAAQTLKQPAGVDVWDFSAGRPLDSTTAGERGWLAETGVGLFVDPFHAGLRADEFTGVWAFYPDQLLRLSGHTVQRWSSTEEFESGDDEGELYEVRRTWVYPWEGHGLWYWNQVTPGRGSAHRPAAGEPPLPQRGQGDLEVQPERVQAGATGEAVREPELFTQLPAARGLELGGYLGQGGHRLLSLPRQPQTTQERLFRGVPITTGVVGEAVLQTGEPPPPEAYVPPAGRTDPLRRPGVLEEHRTLPGAYHLRSAKRIVLTKRGAIPTPNQRLTPADHRGDAADVLDDAAYTPSGLADPADDAAPDDVDDFGTHVVSAGLFHAQGSPQRAAALPDFLAYAFNWEGLHPLAYHARDWDVPDEGPAGGTLSNQRVPAYSRLGVGQYLDDPTPVELDVDHRYGAVKYYENEAAVALLDDGQVVVYDGWGSQLVMGSGHVTLTCPGDFNVRCGRGFNVWAGDDVNLRAQNSIDLTTSARDVRVKAQGSAYVLAGVGGCGGVVIESQAVCPAYAFEGRQGEAAVASGITLLAPDSAVYALTPDWVLESPADDGRAVFDLGAEGLVRHRGRFHQTLVSAGGARQDLFASGPDCDSANEFTADYSLLGGDLYAGGGVYAAGGVTAGGVVAGLGGVAQNDSTAVVRPVKNADALRDALDRFDDRAQQLSGDVCGFARAAAVGPPHADEAETTLRTDAQYRTGGYEIWEARWQAMARLDGQTLPVWAEPVVAGRVSGLAARPHPGGAWGDDFAFLTQPLDLVTTDSGWNAVPRAPGGDPAAAYTDPQIATALAYSPESLYTVAVPPG